MLTDMMVEEEFEIKEEEPWYDHRDLEHDLHLAAELGKTLLDRNRELEEGLQQMYSTNQEQLQEIEHLSKQVDLLRQMNEQHAKLYEQLDVSARELELTNQRLVVENRSSQHRIQGLTETIESLQAQVEELQRQAEELRAPRREDRLSRDLAEQCRSTTTQSVSCLKELYDMRKYFVYDHVFAERIVSGCSERSAAEEENGGLRRAVAALRAQLGAERGRRRAAEQEAALIARENGELEQRLGELEACRGRVRELEADVDELRQAGRADAAFLSRVERLLPEAAFFPEPLAEEEEEEERAEGPAPERRPLKRCSSAEEIRRGHERTCARRSEAVKQRGISLLNEVDAQYSALQVKYEELLRRCQLGEDGLSHKAVQTARRPSRGALPLPSPGADEPLASPDGQQPEYKALFQEIFSCIQKTKEDLSENRAGQAL
ncbi:cerebellar degeneration-related protein 2 [Lepisosteus oculatus]|uniref:cerebellar degeneration-related protein 2 n=1 Tax=Lepisosteus oculatus TaxID=7918 RepID=UPI0035F5136A